MHAFCGAIGSRLSKPRAIRVVGWSARGAAWRLGLLCTSLGLASSAYGGKPVADRLPLTLEQVLAEINRALTPQGDQRLSPHAAANQLADQVLDLAARLGAGIAVVHSAVQPFDAVLVQVGQAPAGFIGGNGHDIEFPAGVVPNLAARASTAPDGSIRIFADAFFNADVPDPFDPSLRLTRTAELRDGKPSLRTTIALVNGTSLPSAMMHLSDPEQGAPQVLVETGDAAGRIVEHERQDGKQQRRWIGVQAEWLPKLERFYLGVQKFRAQSKARSVIAAPVSGLLGRFLPYAGPRYGR